MAKVECKVATLCDAEALAPLLREADALECRRSSGLDALAVLRESWRVSEGQCWIASFDGEPVAIFGIVEQALLSPVAVPWLLTTKAVEKHPKSFFRLARAWVSLWQADWPYLLQFVDAEYTGAVRFLRALGFVIHRPVPHGPGGALFYPAVRTRHV